MIPTRPAAGDGVLARVVPSAALAALASPVAPRVAPLRIGRMLLTAEAPRALRRTVEELGIGAALRTVEVLRIEAVLRVVEVLRVGGALRIAAVHRIGETLRFVQVLRIGGAARGAKQVLQSGIRQPDDGRVRARGPADHALLVRPVAMIKILVAARPRPGEEGPTGEEGTSVVEANSPDTEMDRPGIHRWHVEVGAGPRRPNRAVTLIARNLMLRQMATRSPHYVMVKDVASAAKTGSGFRRRFRAPVLRLVVRWRIGFEPAVSLSTAN